MGAGPSPAGAQDRLGQPWPVHTERLQPRRATEIPVVLYPAIYLNDQKQWRTFFEVIDRAHESCDFLVDVRLHESHLITERAMTLSRRD